jgi:hypothetical protein
LRNVSESRGICGTPFAVVDMLAVAGLLDVAVCRAAGAAADVPPVAPAPAPARGATSACPVGFIPVVVDFELWAGTAFEVGRATDELAAAVFVMLSDDGATGPAVAVATLRESTKAFGFDTSSPLPSFARAVFTSTLRFLAT